MEPKFIVARPPSHGVKGHSRKDMDPFLGRATFHIGFYIAFVAGALLLFLEKGTAEYVITQFTLGVGLVYLLLVVILVQWGKRREQ